ncbi:YgaP family membrane protein [Pseudomonas sp.]|uniref:YgaP family membrane protein n=1 Tax=Pseudomonas sp. TaxID=306 RepID=UPI002729B8D6|nr:DUF2892 domain-containing protein [Pseudomonas sp.]
MATYGAAPIGDRSFLEPLLQPPVSCSRGNYQTIQHVTGENMKTQNSPQGNAVQRPETQSEHGISKMLPFHLPEATNVKGWERMASIGGGALLFARGMRKGGLFGIANLAMGAAAVYRGVTGHCEMKKQISKKMG